MYKLDITKSAGKFLSRLDAKQFRQALWAVLRLKEEPEPHDSKRLIGHNEFRHIDVGEFRVVYRLEIDTIKIAIVGKPFCKCQQRPQNLH